MNFQSATFALLLTFSVIRATNPTIDEKMESRPVLPPSGNIALLQNDLGREIRKALTLVDNNNEEFISQWINMDHEDDENLCLDKTAPFNISWGSDSTEKRPKAAQESDLQNNVGSSQLKRYRKRMQSSGTPATDRPFICLFQGCCRAFQRSYHLEVHMRVHTGERPFKCDFPNCQKSFSQHGNFKAHKRMHTGERPFKCDFSGCQMSFSQCGNFEIHKRIHTGERPFKCDFPDCQKFFSNSSNLKKHAKTHNME